MDEVKGIFRTLTIALAGIAAYIIVQQFGWAPPLNVSPTIYLDSVEMRRK